MTFRSGLTCSKEMMPAIKIITFQGTNATVNHQGASCQDIDSLKAFSWSAFKILTSQPVITVIIMAG